MPNQILLYVFGGLAALLLGFGYLRRQSRLSLWCGGVAAGCAAAAAHYDSFWTMTCFGALALWGAVAATSIVDLNWRMRFGLVASIFIIAILSLWPSFSAMSGGALPCPKWVQDHVNFRLVAGLDLRGGMRLVYTVDVEEAIRDRRDRRYEDMRLELAKIFLDHQGDERPTDEQYEKLRERVVVAPVRSNYSAISLEAKSEADAAKIDTKFLSLFSGDLTFSKSEDGKRYDFHMRESAETEIRGTAVAQAREIILRRVDELGLREASVSTRDEDIIVEVPGQDEESFQEIRDTIGQTARLEFKLLDDDNNFFGPMAANLADQGLPKGVSFRGETVSVGLDDEGKIQQRPNSFAFIARVKEEATGKLETSKQALERLKKWTETLELPPDREFGYELVYETDPNTNEETESGYRTYLLKSRADITGEMIRDAQAVSESASGGFGGWVVSLRFTDQGGSIFAKVTGANVKRRFAIILDERVASAPVIQTKIAGGSAQISMGASDPQTQLREARKLELVLRSGALPAPISPSNEQHIGPSLGKSSIRLGVRGALVGAIAVLAFMMLYYRRAGIIADIAVATNLMLQLAILASFEASITLPGIAGFALVIGMSVDSNVLINERIREELRGGKSPRAAVELGYGKALSAIVDGHLTTLISAIVLAQFGTGPIKGFAVTLMVGVTTSIFTGVVVSRLLFDLWTRGMGRGAKLDIG